MEDTSTREGAHRPALAAKPVSTAEAATTRIIGIAALAFTAPWVKLANFQPAIAAALRVGLATPGPHAVRLPDPAFTQDHKYWSHVLVSKETAPNL